MEERMKVDTEAKKNIHFVSTWFFSSNDENSSTVFVTISSCNEQHSVYL